MPDLDLDALAAVAEAATPGPWEYGIDGWTETISGDGEDWSYVRRVGENEITSQMLHGGDLDEQTERDHAHIAAFDPPTVLALIAEAREARRLRGEVAALADEYGDAARTEGYGGELWSTTEANLRALIGGER